jgi:integrase
MSPPSILHQVALALDVLRWDKARIENYKATHGVLSVKRALRPGGNPTRALPAILGRRTRDTYLEVTTPFFRRARRLSGKRLLAELLDEQVIRKTLEVDYRDHQPASLRGLLAAIGKVHMGCQTLGWARGPSPITDELREHVKSFRDDGRVRRPRFGYKPADARRLVQHMQAGGSSFALAAEVALRCGLRLSEVAGLKGSDIDTVTALLHICGKGGRRRDVPVPRDLLAKLNPSLPWVFSPTVSWKGAFYRAVRKAARELGIGVSGVHRLRSNYAMTLHAELTSAGYTDQQARREVSRRLGHNRVAVTNSYIPPGTRQEDGPHDED